MAVQGSIFGSYGKPSTPKKGFLKKYGSTALTVAGTAVGAYFGGPAGASLGGSLGRGVGEVAFKGDPPISGSEGVGAFVGQAAQGANKGGAPRRSPRPTARPSKHAPRRAVRPRYADVPRQDYHARKNRRSRSAPRYYEDMRSNWRSPPIPHRKRHFPYIHSPDELRGVPRDAFSP